ncbi:UvrD-helicase domain-containing protein [Aestuariicella hydrocarbonica]|uniref:DNA 3'-5' helicase n=1 Tax=Pseudomaricurvus hydrocarbonicus TaxID=1470433 RepID=A0A9E5JVI1_9GAMM|nr:UvrD-helicase domain-containing protein [Aestuariicella hydrocarbonica]NHO65310.1 UvrD-helicase domain-containing protein [Aestuariicella hydrocarbonica]
MQPQDHLARTEALNPRDSFAVTAPAGSGKTGLLTQRVLTLLPLCDNPEEVVCITFTRKAAAEMQERITDAIHYASQHPRPTEPHEQLTWDLAQKVIERDQHQHWQLLKNPNRLRVQTIDGLCRSLTQYNPITSGIGGSSQMLEHPQVVYRQAVEQTLAALEQEGQLQHDLKELFAHLDNNIEAVTNLLISLLGKRDQWLLPLLSARDAREYLENVLHELVVETLEETTDLLLPHASDLCLLADYAGTNSLEDKPESLICQLAGIVELPPCRPEALGDWHSLVEFLLTKGGDWRAIKGLNKNFGFPAGTDKESKAAAKQKKDAMAQLLGQLGDEKKLLDLLQLIRILPPTHYPHQQWRMLDGLTRIMPYAVIQLKLAFRALNATDFSEITQGALMALGDEDAPSDLSLLLDYQIQHILVDEFQDTASPQLQLLERLTAGWQPGDGRTLFIVGDGMQSCYGFRDANVGIFLDARNNGIGDIKLTPLELTVNFRSQSGVVDWVNTAFANAFPEADDISRGAVTYAPSVGFKPAMADPAVKTHVFMEAPDRKDEAAKVVQLVRETLSTNDTDRVAILVRNRPHLKEIIHTLQAAGLRWQATDIDPLSSRMAIVDLLSLTRALLDPSDRNAWIAILRSPVIGLDNSDLLKLVQHHKAPDQPAFPAVLSNLLDYQKVQGLSKEGKQILGRAVPQIRTAWNNRRRKSLRLWIEGLWVALGGPACVPDSIDLTSAQDFFSLLDKFDEGGKVLQWDEFSRSVKQLYARPAADADPRIQVMTIHKSKGLEFETVIIPGLDKTQRSDEKQLILWQERINKHHEKQLLLGPLSATGDDDDPLYQFLRQEQKVKSTLEATRLLYVGCTRAIKHLHLIANLNFDAKTEAPKAPAAGSLLAPLWPAVKDSALLSLVGDSEESAPKPQPIAMIRRLKPDWQRPALVPSSLLAAYRGREFDDDNNTVTDEYLRHRAARYTGTVLHRTLGQIVHDGVEAWNSDRIRLQQPYWRSQLRQLGLSGSPLNEALNRIELGLHRMLADPAGRWILNGQHQQSACEQSFWSAPGPSADNASARLGSAQNSIIDRTFVDQGIRWIIDYKSSEPASGQPLTEFLADETDLYRPQLRRYQQLFTPHTMAAADRGDDGKPLVVKTALYFPLLAHFEEVL